MHKTRARDTIKTRPAVVCKLYSLPLYFYMGPTVRTKPLFPVDDQFYRSPNDRIVLANCAKALGRNFNCEPDFAGPSYLLKSRKNQWIKHSDTFYLSIYIDGLCSKRDKDYLWKLFN